MNQDLFGKLSGNTAQALVILGLTLVLLAPVISAYRWADVSSARTKMEKSGQLIELDIENLRKEQQVERQKDNMDLVMTAEDRQRRENDRIQALNSRREELQKANDSISLRRNVLEAEIANAGQTIPLLLGWIGRLFLLVGLLTMTVQSEGTKQKVLLIILLVVMFSALSGVNLDFTAAGHLGDARPPR